MRQARKLLLLCSSAAAPAYALVSVSLSRSLSCLLGCLFANLPLTLTMASYHMSPQFLWGCACTLTYELFLVQGAKSAKLKWRHAGNIVVNNKCTPSIRVCYVLVLLTCPLHAQLCAPSLLVLYKTSHAHGTTNLRRAWWTRDRRKGDQPTPSVSCTQHRLSETEMEVGKELSSSQHAQGAARSVCSDSWLMYMYERICIHTSICTYVHMCMYVCLHMYIHIHIYIHIYIYVERCIYIYIICIYLRRCFTHFHWAWRAHMFLSNVILWDWVCCTTFLHDLCLRVFEEYLVAVG